MVYRTTAAGARARGSSGGTGWSGRRSPATNGAMADAYHDAPIAVRADLADAHRRIVEGWAAPGNHWTGAQRLAMVGQARAARRHGDLPPWIGPTTVDDLVAAVAPARPHLPDAAIDAVWRLTNHPGTLTEDWYRGLVERGLQPEAYVELVGVVATVRCLDVFADAIGAAPLSLPAATEGEPDGAGEPGAEVTTHWVPTLSQRGPNVGRALTAVPVARDAWRLLSEVQYVPPEALLGDLTWSRGALDRTQVELLAARTSLLNECFY